MVQKSSYPSRTKNSGLRVAFDHKVLENINDSKKCDMLTVAKPSLTSSLKPLSIVTVYIRLFQPLCC